MKALTWFSVALLSLSILSCGGGEPDKTGNTGTLTFGVKWVVPAQQKPGETPGGNIYAAVDCAAVGVATITVDVKNSSGSTVAAGGPWACTDHTGTINAVPVGTNYTVIVDGKDSSATIIYRGEQAGVNILAGVTNDAGTITVLPTGMLSPPTGVGWTAGNGQVALSWTGVPGATSYNVYYNTAPGVTAANGTKIAGASSGGAITGLTNGTTYYFVITAVNAVGESAVSSEVSATPQLSAPTGVTATAANAQVTVSWTVVTGASSYNVYYGTTAGEPDGSWAKVTGAASGGAITGLLNGSTYYFVVTAVNAVGESSISSVVSATPSATLLNAPTGITATADNAQVTVSWTAVTGATSYNMYYGTTAGVAIANGTKVTGATSGSAITGLTNGTTYYFVVTAVNAGGESALSAEVAAYTTLKVPKFAYVANGTSNDVSVYTINQTTGALTAGTAVAAGISPRSVTVDPTGKFAYVANNAPSNVSVYAINQTTGALTAGTAVASGTGPMSVTVDPSGKFAYVANRDSNDVSVYTINQTTGALTAGTVVAAGTQPVSVTVDPTGKFAYVANQISNNISVYTINQTTGALTAGTAVAAGTQPESVAVDPTGKFAYVANYGSNTVSVYTINQTTGALTAVTGSPFAAGTRPFSVTVDPTGRFAYVANSGSNTVSVYTMNQTTGALTAVTGSPFAAGTGPTSVTVDPSGKFAYVANNASNNVSVYTINQTTGVLTAGTAVAAGINPQSVTVTAGVSSLMGGAMQVTPLNLTAVVTTLAGGAGVVGSTNGTGTAARFYYPFGITTDGTNLYVADTYNDTIRKVVIATGAVTTFAGIAGVAGSTDGSTGAVASFSHPFGITTDGTNLYVADSDNRTIRKIVISTSVVTTLAGSAGVVGSTDGTGSSARFNTPQGITTDGTNLYVADTWNYTIRKIVISTGLVTTLAGSAGVVGSTDGTGTAARFNISYGITTDGTNLYVADTVNHTMRKVVLATGVVTTLAGSAGVVGSTDDTGTAARFNIPGGITTDGTNLYVADTVNNTIRKIQ